MLSFTGSVYQTYQTLYGSVGLEHPHQMPRPLHAQHVVLQVQVGDDQVVLKHEGKKENGLLCFVLITSSSTVCYVTTEVRTISLIEND